MAWIWTLVACAAFPGAGGAAPAEASSVVVPGTPVPVEVAPPAPRAALQVDLHLDTPTQLHRRSVGLDGSRRSTAW